MNANQLQSERPQIEPRWLLPLIDVILVFLAFAVAYYIRYELQIIRPVYDPVRTGFSPYLPYIVVYALILYLHYQGGGLYRNIRGRSWTEEVYIIANGVANATVILLALFFVLQPLVTSRLMLVYMAGLTVVFLSIARLIRTMILSALREKGIGVQNVLILGMGEAGQAVLRTIVARSDLGYKPVGYLDDNDQKGLVDLGRVKGLGKLDNLKEMILEHKVDMVVITLRWRHYDRIQEAVRICRKAKVQVRMLPDTFQLNMNQLRIENLDGIPLLGLDGNQAFRGTGRFMKRVMDMLLVLISAPIWGLFFAIVAIAIRLEGPGPIFYSQRRIGENGQSFPMIKFRSMIPNADQMQEEIMGQAGEDPRHPKIKDDPRITKVGKFLRRTSLDELPNLLNVLQGQMSLVGPRPPTPDEVDLYEGWHMRRLQFIPGMTGLWQVSGRSDIPFEEMCLLDIYYIENWSVNLDLQILLMTVPRVLLQRGAY